MDGPRYNLGIDYNSEGGDAAAIAIYDRLERRIVASFADVNVVKAKREPASVRRDRAAARKLLLEMMDVKSIARIVGGVLTDEQIVIMALSMPEVAGVLMKDGD